MRYHIWTVGCQMNVADSERMASALDAMGASSVRTAQEADVIVLNTCSVRQAAEERALGKLSALRDLKRRKPNVIVALAGCMVGDDSLPELQKRLPFIDAFIRPADVHALRETVRALMPGWSPSTEMSDPSHTSYPHAPTSLIQIQSPSRQSPIGWVPVIYGCNRSCSYCIVPARRGREQSRSIDEIESDVRQMVRSGVREVRLLGQIVDRYGWDLPGKPDLAALFDVLAQVDGLCRIRFLTSHPRDLRDRVIDAIARNRKVCPDLNLPFQAGDDAILKSMRRGYTINFYRKLVARLRTSIPNLSLATDVIVGYPGESQEQFQGTLDLLSEIRFDVVHVAMYSPRPGTGAAELADDVPPTVKKERLQRVEQLHRTIAEELNSGLPGQTVEILVEGQNKGSWEGRTISNKPVFFRDDGDWLGRLADVMIERASAWSLSGNLVGVARNEQTGVPACVSCATLC